MCCRINIVSTFLLTVLLPAALSVRSQDTSLHVLNTTVIIETRYTAPQTGYKNVKADTLIKKQFIGQSLADLMAYDNSFFVKSYGSTGIASSSIRGGNASQSTLNWKGFNVNNPMLGQADLSIVPSFFFNNVSITYGGNACLAGSGSIGGTLFLGNTFHFKKELKAEAFTNYASYGSLRNGAGFTISGNKFYNSTKCFINSGNANYKYGDTIAGSYTIKHLQHTRVFQYGFMQENGFRLNKFQKLEWSNWFQKSSKELPNTLSEELSRKHQEDESFRSALNWSLTKEKHVLYARTGFLTDKLNYIDSAVAIYSKSKSLNFIAELESKFYLRRHTLESGINFNHQQANTKNYSENPVLNKMALFAAWQYQNSKKWFKSSLNVRQEFLSTGQKPFVWSAGFNIIPIDLMSIHTNVGKVFRIPTLNDMYWNPGGNPNLKPEEGYAEEIGIEINKDIKKFNLFFDITCFNRQINNWIAWLPSGGAYWKPVNILEVWSRGCETQSSISYSHKKIKLITKLKTNYILSTYQKAINENDESIGRQLIYTPMYSGSSINAVAYKNLSLTYIVSYTGYRYLSSDNYQYLKPYWLNNISVHYQFKLKSIEGNMFAGIDNLFNTSYQVVANNPMPLRYFKIGLNIQYAKKSN